MLVYSLRFCDAYQREGEGEGRLGGREGVREGREEGRERGVDRGGEIIDYFYALQFDL